MVRKFFVIIMAAVFATMALAGCGSGSVDSMFFSDNNKYAPQQAGNAVWGWDGADTAVEDVAEVETDYDYDLQMDMMEPVEAPVPAANPDTTGSAEGVDTSDIETSERKIIKNGNLTVETLEYDKFTAELDKAVTDYGGYISSASKYGSPDSSNRSADYTIRIPAEKYDSFVNMVGDLGAVIQSDTSTTDVTLEYVDLEARLAVLTTERDSYMALLEKAESVEDILQIQSYLSDVNYQIESFYRRLNSLKNQVTYSTITLYVSEVKRVTVIEKKTVWQRISANLGDNAYNIGEDFKDFFVGVVSSAPYLLIYAVAIGVIVLIVVIIVKKVKHSQKNQLPPPSDDHQPQQ